MKTYTILFSIAALVLIVACFKFQSLGLGQHEHSTTSQNHTLNEVMAEISRQ